MSKKVTNNGQPPKVYRIERDEKTGTVIIPLQFAFAHGL